MRNIKKIIIPRVGMRIIKTALAVLITLLVIDLLFVRLLHRTEFVSVFAVVSAVLTIQDSIRSSFATAVERCIGTLIGVAVGMLFLTFDLLLNKNIYLFYTFITVGTVLVIYGCKIFKKAAASGLCVVVFIAVLFSRDESNPYLAAGVRILETVIGVVIALLVNVLIFPPKTVKIGECNLKGECKLIGDIQGEHMINISEIQPDLLQEITGSIQPRETIFIDKSMVSGVKSGRWSNGDMIEIRLEDFAAAFGINDNKYKEPHNTYIECYDFDEEAAIEAVGKEIDKIDNENKKTLRK